MKVSPDFSRCVLASSNLGKLREVAGILGALGIEIIAQSELAIEGADETGSTFIENALLKARHAASLAGLPAIADDSGLVVDALDGRPGVRSARYAGAGASDSQNIEKLLEELHDVPSDQRQASFHCAAVLVWPDDAFEPIIVQEKWCGVILREPRGKQGFGYDPVFFDPGIGKSAAEMTSAEKNAASHRGKALRRLVRNLQHMTAA